MQDCLALALGLDLTLVGSEEGGRQTPLLNLPDAGWSYRPNWGLPSMTPPDQTGAPVLAFSQPEVAPGDRARAVIITPFPEMVDQWRREVVPGVVLPMYEGSRVCGHGKVMWSVEVRLPLSEREETRLLQWLEQPEAGSPE